MEAGKSGHQRAKDFLNFDGVKGGILLASFPKFIRA
jgi:hypothetical protein